MKLLREPLVQFLLVGAGLFLLFRLANPPDDSNPEQIVISQGLLDHLGTNFERTWQRPPSEEEMAGLVREYIRDEVAYREALAIGLDRDDAIVRRRMRQKLEFLSEDAGAALVPNQSELEAFLAANPESYAIDPEIAFFQVFLDPDRGVETEERARLLLEDLPASPAAAEEISDLGDRMMLPPVIERSPLWQIKRLFGEVFADEIEEVTPGQWSGPIRSGYGWHLVYITEEVPGRAPELAEVRESVLRDWWVQRKTEMMEVFYEALIGKYEIVVEEPEAEPMAAEG